MYINNLYYFAGKRSCLGEQLARMELYIFYTHLMHRFDLKKSADTGSLKLEAKPGGVLTPYPYKTGEVVSPYPFNICATVR